MYPLSRDCTSCGCCPCHRYHNLQTDHDLFRKALERIVREDHTGGAGWMAEIAQQALDSAVGQETDA